MLLPREGLPPIQLSYGANVHPAETPAELIQTLRSVSRGVRERLRSASLGVGLHLHEPLIQALAAPGSCEELKATLDSEGLFVGTANVFPQRAFHAARVKQAVYSPNWSQDERRSYTVSAARTLTQLANPGTEALSLSTLPLGHRDLVQNSPGIRRVAAHQIALAAMDLHALSQQAGRLVQLAIEPEPACILETQADLAHWYTRELVPAAKACGFDEARLREHVGSCLDCCHGAVMHESIESAMQSLHEAEIRIMKVQISAALETDLPAGLAALSRLHEERWLHQTSVRCGQSMFLVEDIDQIPLGARGLTRTHFHIPLHAEPTAPLRNTALTLPRALRALRQLPCAHFEVETYSFGVLPADLARSSLEESVAAELACARDWLCEN